MHSFTTIVSTKINLHWFVVQRSQCYRGGYIIVAYDVLSEKTIYYHAVYQAEMFKLIFVCMASHKCTSVSLH